MTKHTWRGGGISNLDNVIWGILKGETPELPKYRG